MFRILIAASVLSPVSAVAAPGVAPLGGGLHGLVFRPALDGQGARTLQVVATSQTPETIAIPSLPTDLGLRNEDTAVGAYVREEWDKGAFLRDNFSARWTGTLKVENQTEYTFYLTTDDGTRMSVDGKQLVDVWVPRPATTSEAKAALTPGDHAIVVEFYEGGGAAVARLEWSAEGLERQVVPAERVSSEGQPGWRAEYFLNTNLEGEPAVTLTEESIDHNWGEGGVKVGAEEPGQVVLEWTRIADNAIVGRVHSGPASSIGLLTDGAGEDAQQPTVRVLDPGAGAPPWLPATQGSYVFVAGLEPLPELTADDARGALRKAYLAGLKPSLPPGPPDADGWVTLLNGQDLAGWKPRWGDSLGDWLIQDGVLSKAAHGGVDLVSEWTFLDYDLHVEFTYPQGSNSGVYFQGRYEIQILDSFNGPVESHQCGALYGIQAPKENVTKPAGEWQTLAVSFASATLDDNGRVVPARISITHNGVLTIDDAEIPRATGGEMDRNYLQPGPIMLQGTHGPVSFRNVRVRVTGDG